jgi:hypothetical protein
MNTARKLQVLAVGLTVLLAGCGANDGGTAFSADPAITTTTSSATVQSTTTVVEDELPTTTVADYAAFIAGVDDALSGTSYEGTVLDDVEVYVATAQLFCDLLGEGMTSDEVLTVYLDRLADERETELDEDDGTMAGVVLGAAVAVVCPDHEEKVARRDP